MIKLFWATVVIAILAAFFASSHPDGLDFVAEKMGFGEKGIERTAVMAGYGVQGLPEGGISTSAAGIAGILITLAVFWLAAYILKRGDNGMKKTMAILFAALLACSSPAFAARPLVTDDFGTVDTGEYELEFGYNSITPKTGGSSTNGLVAQIKRGFTPNFDLGLELPYNMSGTAGFADTVLHAKLRIREFGEDEGITARADIKLSTGNAAAGLGSGFLDGGLIAILSKKISGMNMHFNAGYIIVGDPANSACNDTFVYGAALENPINGNIDLAVEYTGISCQLGSSGNLQVGARYQATDSIRFDAGYSAAMNDSSNNVATGGLTACF